MDVKSLKLPSFLIGTLLILTNQTQATGLVHTVFNEDTYQHFKCLNDDTVGADELYEFLSALEEVKLQPEGEYFVVLDGDYTSELGNSFAVMDEVIVYEKEPGNPELKKIFLFNALEHNLTVSYIGPLKLHGEVTCVRSKISFQNISEIVQPAEFNEHTYKNFNCIPNNQIVMAGLMEFIRSIQNVSKHPDGEYFVKLDNSYTSEFGRAFAVMDEVAVYQRRSTEPGFKDIYLFSPISDNLAVSYIRPFRMKGKIYCNQSKTIVKFLNDKAKLIDTATVLP